MKIIIIGAGIAGLSTYLFLKKHLLASSLDGQHDIKIYEAYDVTKSSFRPAVDKQPNVPNEPVFTAEAIGAAIGISRNGLNVFRRLDDTGKLLNELIRRGHTVKSWEMSTARGWVLVDVNLAGMDTASEMAAKSTLPRMEEDDQFVPHAVMIARQACWEILRDGAVVAGAVERRRVVNVVIGEGDSLNVVKFADGTEEEADLVIGADGLKSVLRKAMFQNGIPGGPPQNEWLLFKWFSSKVKEPVDYISPHYEGLVGVGGFVPSSILQATNHPPGTMAIVFGPTGFFGYGYVTSSASANVANAPSGSTSTPPPRAEPGPLSGWWSTFSSPTPHPFALPDTDPNVFDRDAALANLLKRHRGWENPTIQAILDYAEAHGIESIYPTWTTPELPTWQCNGKVVLVGDAAHALQPSSGQGACQALEDAESLSLLLKHYLSFSDQQKSTSCTHSGEQAAIGKALDKFVQLRKPRLHSIYLRSQMMSNLKTDRGFIMEIFTYAMIKSMTWFRDAYFKQLMKYDVPTEVEKIIHQE